jgi:hypothetical protein
MDVIKRIRDLKSHATLINLVITVMLKATVSRDEFGF